MFTLLRTRPAASSSIEAVALQRIAFDVATTALLLPIFLGAPGLNRERSEAPVLGKRRVHLVHVRVVDARAQDARLEIVEPYDGGHALEITERALMEPEKRVQLLIPHGFFVAVPRARERQPEHPRPLPLARRGVPRRRPAKEINLALLSGVRFEDADGSVARRNGPQIAFDRFVAVAVPELFGQVLPDALGGQALRALLENRILIMSGREASRRSRAGERFGRICLRAGERVGRI